MKDRENILKEHNSNIQTLNQITPRSITEVIQFNSSLSTLSTSSNNISKISNYKIPKFENEKTIPNSFSTNNTIYSSKINSKKYFYSPSYSLNKPTLTSQSSKKFLLEYSKSKKYEEDKELYNEIYNKEEKINLSKILDNENYSNYNNNNLNDTIDEYQELLLNQEKNLPVPIEKKNDEKFKLMKMRQMKRKSFPANKSVRKYEDLENEYEKNLNTIVKYSTLKKKKITQSTKKIYSSYIEFKDKNNKKQIFIVFSDRDIGIYEYWQNKIIESKNDEDIDTDNEQIKLAVSYSIGEIKEAFDFICKNKKDAFVNFNRYSNFMCK
jgi:hypothetical protein